MDISVGCFVGLQSSGECTLHPGMWKSIFSKFIFYNLLQEHGDWGHHFMFFGLYIYFFRIFWSIASQDIVYNVYWRTSACFWVLMYVPVILFKERAFRSVFILLFCYCHTFHWYDCCLAIDVICTKYIYLFVYGRQIQQRVQ